MIRVFFLVIILSSSCFGNVKNTAKISNAEASSIIGKKIRSFLDETEYTINYDELIQALRDTSPITKEEEEELEKYKKNIIFEISSKNLAAAEKTLLKNIKEKNFIEILPSKLQYHILNKGNDIEVKEQNSPLILLTQKLVDGTIVKEESFTCNLSEESLLLKKIIVGMREKEKREIFIHPSIDLFEKDEKQPPNSLIIFEVEVIQSNFKKETKFPPHSIISNKIRR